MDTPVNLHMHFDHPPPRSWEHFEELCADTFQEEWHDGSLIRNGRTGQAQNGVDIVGRMGAEWPVGIQCKRKSVWPVKTVSTAELDEEVEKAKGFQPPLKAFYLVSTAPDDAPLSEHARKVTERHAKQNLFSVTVLGWTDIVRRATRHRLVAAKHFGAYSEGPAAPLLASWNAAGGRLLLGDRELAIAVRELIHDLGELPAGRIVFRQEESEALLFEINQRRAAHKLTLDDREAVLELRDRLKRLTDREQEVVAGLRLLFGHKVLRDYVRVVWTKHIALLVRSFVEQAIDNQRGTVTGMEKIRIHPPGSQHDPLAIFLPAEDHGTIMRHAQALRERFPRVPTDIVSELPDDVQFGQIVPEILRHILRMVDEGVPLEQLEQQKWLHTHEWKVTT